MESNESPANGWTRARCDMSFGEHQSTCSVAPVEETLCSRAARYVTHWIAMYLTSGPTTETTSLMSIACDGMLSATNWVPVSGIGPQFLCPWAAAYGSSRGKRELVSPCSRRTRTLQAVFALWRYRTSGETLSLTPRWWNMRLYLRILAQGHEFVAG